MIQSPDFSQEGENNTRESLTQETKTQLDELRGEIPEFWTPLEETVWDHWFANPKVTFHQPKKSEEIQNSEDVWSQLTRKFEHSWDGSHLWVGPDPDGKTKVIGYGTNLWTNGSYVADVREYLKQTYTSWEINAILAWKQPITEADALGLFEMRHSERTRDLASALEWVDISIGILPTPVRDILSDLAYNLSWWVLWVLKFENMLKALKNENYIEAANELRDSKYAKDVWPRRAWFHIGTYVEIARKNGQSIQWLSEPAKAYLIEFKQKHEQDFIEAWLIA